MSLDYEKIGLKCGLEIHQQLDTKKLFCNCPSLLRKDEPDIEVRRKLHAVAGESGEIDIAAQYHASLDRTFNYQGYKTTCLVELDESPPREINLEALRIALQVSVLLNTQIMPITQIMRKTVIDGSNTSGFQRTVLIAKDGWIETSQGKVGIESICLEEDSARIISESNGIVTYRLDRLGIPLIEIATAADIKSPSQAKEVALFLGNVLRSCKVKRGIGTIRQDVNVSVKKGKRVEIKGVQEPQLIEKSVELEAKRQAEMIKTKKKFDSEVRKVLPDGKTEFLRPMPGASRMYPETDLPLLRIRKELINDVKKNLPKLRHETEKELFEKGLNKEMVGLLLKARKLDEFKELLKIYNNPKLVLKILLIYPKEIASREKISREKIEKILNKDVLEFVLENLNNGKITEHQIKHVLGNIAKGKSAEEAIVFEEQDLNSLEEKILKIMDEKPGLSLNAYMGLIMKNPEFRGKVSGKEVAEIFKKHSK